LNQPASSGAQHGFPREARLLSAGQFAEAFEGRRLGSGKLLALHVAPAGRARLGLVVGKRMAPLAVTRNTIKRVLREAFRLQQHALPPAHYVFRLHRPVGAISLGVLKRQVRAEADSLLGRAIKSGGSGVSIAGQREPGKPV